MRVSELIDMLKDQPPDAEVELAIVSPVNEDEDDITVDRYTVEGMLHARRETRLAADRKAEPSPTGTLFIGQTGEFFKNQTARLLGNTGTVVDEIHDNTTTFLPHRNAQNRLGGVAVFSRIGN